MVAISLYKGNLHKVPDVPRRWMVPVPSISLENFRVLIHRRSLAFARLQASSEDAAGDPASTSNPNDVNADPVPDNNYSNGSKVNNLTDDSRAVLELPPRNEEKAPAENGEVQNDKLIGAEDPLKELVDKSETLVEKEAKCDDKAEVPVNPVVQRNSIEDANSDKEKRKKEVKERLEILNEKKHSLVQVLKQILNAEEQLKRRNSMQQGVSGRPSLPLQVDTTTDSGSMTKVNTPRLGSDGNPCGDVDGGQPDDVSNQNAHSRHLPRMNSTSPSSGSPLRKPGSNMVPHSYRTTLGIVGSPSRFAPPGQVQSVSVSGTNYVASSPSPAASGGTSVFRDGRLPSPWN